MMHPISFPWEPCYQKRKKPTESTDRLVPANPRDQLAFLASMTFTNGGMLAPSCLCCQ
jgi:hypothetical protein